MLKLIKSEDVEWFRITKGLSKAEFCKKCNVSYSVYAKILNYQYNFRINALLKIAKFMDVDFRTLLCDENV